VGAEIERKFLLRELPGWLGECRSQVIEQGYLALEGEREVRVRRLGERGRLTVKGGHGLVREEHEVGLDPAQLAVLWPLTEGRRLSKRRYLRPEPEGTIEIDVFDGELSGLILAEVEFRSVVDSEAFSPAGWLGEEVTGDPRFANRALAARGTPR